MHALILAPLRNGAGVLTFLLHPTQGRMEGISKTVLVVGSMASAMLLASMAAVLTAVLGFGKPRTVTLVGAGDIAGCDSRPTAKRQGCWAKYLEPFSPSATTSTPTAPARSSATATIPHGASTRSARGPRSATKTITPPGRSPTSITSDGVLGSPVEATTPTIEGPGTSWPSTATARRSVGVTGHHRAHRSGAR